MENSGLFTFHTLSNTMFNGLSNASGALHFSKPRRSRKMVRSIMPQKEKVTKLHFYFHDQQSGKHPTAVIVAQANMSTSSPTFFGTLLMMDDPLRVGPEPSSALVGRAQGIYGSVGIDQVSLLMSMNYVFTSGKYNGSTLSVLGKNAALEKYRELPIIGGTGAFRLARGIVTAKTYWVNMTSGDAIVKHDVVVVHY